MTGEEKRAARLAAARAEFAAYPAPPTPGWWPCPKDPGQFRYYDGTGWTDQTLEPAMKPDPPAPAGAAWQPAVAPPPAPRPAEPEPPPGRGSAIAARQAEMQRLVHPVTADDLRGIPEAHSYVAPPLPDPPARGWWVDPAAPDLDQQRFHTGTAWSDFTAMAYKGRVSYHRSTMEEARRRKELQLEERKHRPRVTLGSTAATGAVFLTAFSACLLVMAPALPAGWVSHLVHSGGIVGGLAVLVGLCYAAVQTDRQTPPEWRSFPISVPYALTVVGFIVIRGFHSVLAALGLH